ncbi:unnamed protein product [Lymnaea stagnalis]|uniref:C2H2-type domain-containing protein n=1 Tax=Lymnaea stagnalis TaxID=6523 RepID=A0AAV2IA20_LYMST
MQRHVKLHTRGPIPKAHLLDWTRRPYACGVCKMGFTRQHHLTRHMLIHTGERPHSCHVCGKAFRRYTNLSLHVRTVHGAERPFKCHICGRGFPRLYSLQRHLKLHAKNAASIAQAADEQMYKDFKPVGTVNLENLNTLKSPAYGAGNAEATRPSPGHSRESSSDHSDDSERYDHESDHHEDNMGNIDPDGHSGSPLQEHRVYNQTQGDGFNPQQSSQPANQSAINSQNSSSSQHSQGTARINQQNSRPGSHEQEIMNQANRISRHEVEGMRRPTPIHNQGGSDYNSASVMQTSNNERYNTPTSIPNQNIRNIDMPVSLANFSEIDMRREASVYSLSQRGNADGFNVHQQRIQSPHPMMTNLERPGSRGMMTQQGTPDGFHHNPSGFTQQQVPLPAQQRVSMDLSATRNTMSPVGIRDPSVYHHIDMGGSRGGMNDPPAYPHPHTIGSLPFTSLYQQQQLTDNLNHMELHPNPAASPMPVNTHNTNIQY